MKLPENLQTRSIALFLLLGYNGLFCWSGIAQKFAVIGDYGVGDSNAYKVAQMVRSFSPEFIITTGDNNYPSGAAATIDKNVGQFYSAFIYPYYGVYEQGPITYNRFYPSLGNHDADYGNLQAYLDYFTLPGNERYYKFTRGYVQFFVINSTTSESDGNTVTSFQAKWLKKNLDSSVSNWKIVYFHHCPYSSGYHGNTAYMQWPFDVWGADAVISGHDHSYERLMVNGIPYFVNGSGGMPPRSFNEPLVNSQVRYSGLNGAQIVEAYKDSLVFMFYAVNDSLIDRYVIKKQDFLNSSADDPKSYKPVRLIQKQMTGSIELLFTVNNPGYYSLCIYSINGVVLVKKTGICTLTGEQILFWDSSSLPSGLYIIKLAGTDFTETFKVLLIN